MLLRFLPRSKEANWLARFHKAVAKFSSTPKNWEAQTQYFDTLCQLLSQVDALPLLPNQSEQSTVTQLPYDSLTSENKIAVLSEYLFSKRAAQQQETLLVYLKEKEESLCALKRLLKKKRYCKNKRDFQSQMKCAIKIENGVFSLVPSTLTILKTTIRRGKTLDFLPHFIEQELEGIRRLRPFLLSLSEMLSEENLEIEILRYAERAIDRLLTQLPSQYAISLDLMSCLRKCLFQKVKQNKMTNKIKTDVSDRIINQFILAYRERQAHETQTAEAYRPNPHPVGLPTIPNSTVLITVPYPLSLIDKNADPELWGSYTELHQCEPNAYLPIRETLTETHRVYEQDVSQSTALKKLKAHRLSEEEMLQHDLELLLLKPLIEALTVADFKEMLVPPDSSTRFYLWQPPRSADKSFCESIKNNLLSLLTKDTLSEQVAVSIVLDSQVTEEENDDDEEKEGDETSSIAESMLTSVADTNLHYDSNTEPPAKRVCRY